MKLCGLTLRSAFNISLVSNCEAVFYMLRDIGRMLFI